MPAVPVQGDVEIRHMDPIIASLDKGAQLIGLYHDGPVVDIRTGMGTYQFSVKRYLHGYGIVGTFFALYWNDARVSRRFLHKSRTIDHGFMMVTSSTNDPVHHRELSLPDLAGTTSRSIATESSRSSFFIVMLISRVMILTLPAFP